MGQLVTIDDTQKESKRLDFKTLFVCSKLCREKKTTSLLNQNRAIFFHFPNSYLLSFLNKAIIRNLKENPVVFLTSITLKWQFPGCYMKYFDVLNCLSSSVNWFNTYFDKTVLNRWHPGIALDIDLSLNCYSIYGELHDLLQAGSLIIDRMTWEEKLASD